ncbi:hypothetical protein TNCV_706081 [Trichonephila clavipes]|nr:hypothetical protein TNCV_706081 [Trichonephila clavipes]
MSYAFPQWESARLNEQIKVTPHVPVVYQCLVGGREETIEQHRWKVLQQVAEWINIPSALSMHQDDCVKDQLLQLLSKGIKRKNLKKIPQDASV